VREDSIPIHPGQKYVPVAETTTTANISSRGCYFPLSWKLPLGTRLELEIKLPGRMMGLPEVMLCCQGKVIRVDKPSNAGQVGIAATINSYRLAARSDETKEPREAALAG